MITELNDPSYVTTVGNQGNCTWCDGGMFGGSSAPRTRGQIIEVTSVAGTTLGISPLYSDFGVASGTNPVLVTPFTASAKFAGVEQLQVFANKTGYTTNFQMNKCMYCWIKGVHGNFADGDHVQVWLGFHDEIRDSYFHDGYSHTSGTTDNDIFIDLKTSGTLVENNILTRLHSSIILNWGAAGNVVAYNFFDGNYDTNAPNVLIYDQTSHGAHPQFNLWEGNVGPTWHQDSIWGSSSHHTAFRNWMTGITNICLPYSSRGTPGACHIANQANRPTGVNFEVTSSNLVGNIGGSAALKGQMSETAVVIAPSSRGYNSAGYDMDFGYGDSGNGNYGNAPGVFSCTGAPSSCLSYSSSFIHGVYTNANSSIIWDSGHSDHTLPPSFFKSAKPEWWGSLPWPAIGPDVTGGNGPGGHASLTASNPAQACYNSTAQDGNGYLLFDPNACYGSGGGDGPAPPVGLSGVAH